MGLDRWRVFRVFQQLDNVEDLLRRLDLDGAGLMLERLNLLQIKAALAKLLDLFDLVDTLAENEVHRVLGLGSRDFDLLGF